MRCFISIEIESSVKNNIDNMLKNNIKKYFRSIKWVKPENLHITLAFFKNITDKEISSIKKALQSVLVVHQPFTIELSGLYCFPNYKNPKVLWIGINNQPKLFLLKRDIDRELDALNISYDKKNFSPHLTIGRIKYSTKINHDVFKTFDFKESVLVNEIHLMKSDLFPEGPMYTQLFCLKLGKENFNSV